MRAVWLKEFGGPQALVAGQAPEPVPGPGQALVDVAFAGVTFVETQIRAGAEGPFRLEPPVILGNGVGGVITAVGPGADPALVGRKVVTSTGGSGGYAERVAVDAAGVFPVPPGLELDAATALLADGRTAVMLMRAVAPRPGERVLVEAAAGGVGTLLVQLARAAGARVVAAAGGGRKGALARELGAEVAVDYRDPSWTQQVRAAVGGVDVVFDGVGGAVGRAAFDLLAATGGQGARMLRYGRAGGEWTAVPEQTARERGIALLSLNPTPEEIRLSTEHALAEAAAGRLRPVIGQRFPLERAADAHAALESRATVGKTLLEI
ncbi:zinc-binding dehydrogenase [Thermomonospora sp. CIF 1]|uniref:zinc-binding dehydrogenase n=1 Tax=Thermomonospora sp. CIF 1 TaxID=1916083 RepID=UPI000CAF45A3|nr:zinc-binding dehydrogenase [Thermomonospora sp. CIF 1]PKK14534.1 MAG: NADPH:quinone reductase [Thermomonospora sp. CIF 1]